jgi:hypothetical protein
MGGLIPPQAHLPLVSPLAGRSPHPRAPRQGGREAQQPADVGTDVHANAGANAGAGAGAGNRR